MKSQIALNPSQMLELKQAGIDISDASMAWIKKYFSGDRKLVFSNDPLTKNPYFEVIPAYTLEDILLKLGYYTLDYMNNDSHDGYFRGSMETGASSPLETAFNILKWVALSSDFKHLIRRLS